MCVCVCAKPLWFRKQRFCIEEENNTECHIFSILVASHPRTGRLCAWLLSEGQQTLCNESRYGQYVSQNNDSDWCVYSVISPQRLRCGNTVMPVRYFMAGDDISLPALLPVIPFLTRIQQYFSAYLWTYTTNYSFFYSSGPLKCFNKAKYIIGQFSKQFFLM